MKALYLSLFALSSSLITANALTEAIDFNDGTAGVALANFYSAKGATFQNAEWNDFSTGYTPAPESTGLRIVGIGANFQPKVGNPLIASFDQAIKSLSIIANNVNLNGARIDAYDSLIGGNLVDTDQVVGSSGALNSNFTLEILGSNIRRVEFYQPFSAESEGVLFDNLAFSTVPEPSMLGLAMVIGFFVIAPRRRR